MAVVAADAPVATETQTCTFEKFIGTDRSVMVINDVLLFKGWTVVNRDTLMMRGTTASIHILDQKRVWGLGFDVAQSGELTFTSPDPTKAALVHNIKAGQIYCLDFEHTIKSMEFRSDSKAFAISSVTLTTNT